MFGGITLCLVVSTQPYKPFPILFVHGYRALSATWGAVPDRVNEVRYWLSSLFGSSNPIYNPSSDTLYPSYVIDALKENNMEIKVKGYRGPGIFDDFLGLMLPYVQVYDSLGLDTTYTLPEDPAYPNKDFVEIINLNFPLGSFDQEDADQLDFLPEEGILPELRGFPLFFVPWEFQPGWGEEIAQRIRQILREYYGPNWQDNPDAKVVLVAHSMGGVVIAEALRQDPSLKPHIHKVITLGAPIKGAWVLDPFAYYVRFNTTSNGGITA